MTRKNAWVAAQFISLRTALFTMTMLCAMPVTTHAGQCKIRSTDYKGWNAQEIRNDWVRLTIVPKLGGRLMQVTFGPHEFLFVNKQYEGKYLPPIAPNAPAKWYNYGGDKIWPLPEGHQDEHHWPGPLADALDDGDYAFSIVSQGAECKVRLDGPPDTRTGLQYSREIALQKDSPKISFHAVMKNSSAHEIEWSMQSVTQYNTADSSGEKANGNIWAFTVANERSSFAGGYFVRSGSAPAGLSIKDGLVTLNYSSDECELWFDPQGEWLAVADFATQYAMVERFRKEEGKEYPGGAAVIFYMNDGNNAEEKALYYMEAEINSPMVRLQPGETYALDTEWYPTRAGKDFVNVKNAGIVSKPLSISNESGIHTLSGMFGAFFPGEIVAKFLDKDGKQISEMKLGKVTPLEPFKLEKKLRIPKHASRVALHLIDSHAENRGLLDEVTITPGATRE